ncbi:MAG: KEOPS complex subunit Pcc1 [Candidatus Helarchaeota archaeon]
MEDIKAQISINFSTLKIIEHIFNALQPETRTKFSDRSTIQISKAHNSIQLNIEAKDITAFRATINSYLIWLRTLLSVSPLL